MKKNQKSVADLMATKKIIANLAGAAENKMFADFANEVAEAFGVIAEKYLAEETEEVAEEKIEEIVENFYKKKDLSDTQKTSVTNLISKTIKSLGTAGNSKKEVFNKKQKVAIISNAFANGTNFEKAIKDYCVKNTITDISFDGDITSYDLLFGGWNLNAAGHVVQEFAPAFKANEVITTTAITAAVALAKGWSKSDAAAYEKSLQQLAGTTISFTPQVIQKTQELAWSDIMDLGNELPNVIMLLRKEIEAQVYNTILAKILAGTAIKNEAGTTLSVFDAIGNKIVTDTYTYVKGSVAPKMVEAAEVVANMQTVNGRIYGFMTMQNAFLLRTVTKGTGVDKDVMSIEDLTSKLGVAKIIITPFATGSVATFIDMDGYKIRKRGERNVDWEQFGTNEMRFMQEIYADGKICLPLGSGNLILTT